MKLVVHLKLYIIELQQNINKLKLWGRTFVLLGSNMKSWYNLLDGRVTGDLIYCTLRLIWLSALRNTAKILRRSGDVDVISILQNFYHLETFVSVTLGKLATNWRKSFLMVWDAPHRAHTQCMLGWAGQIAKLLIHSW